MCPRPRQATDEDMLKATFRAIARRGPAALTLADVAKEAGVSAPAVVQRFGSKRALLLAAAADAARGSDYIFPGLRSQHASPRAALVGISECMALMGTTPQAVANTLAFVHLDLTDADFHRHAVAGSEGTYEGLRGLVTDAIKAGEIRTCNVDRLAWALLAALNGSLLNWAVHRDGDLQAWIRRDLETVLEPYILERPHARRAGRRPAPKRGRGRG